jgi:hypothetical protein
LPPFTSTISKQLGVFFWAGLIGTT